MKNEDKVITPEQAQKFEELGIKIETNLTWFVDSNFNEDNAYLSRGICFDPYDPDWDRNKVKQYPAPDVAELGEILPDYLEIKKKKHWIYHVSGRGDGFNIFYTDNVNSAYQSLSWYGETEAQARGAAVIWLKKNGYLDL